MPRFLQVVALVLAFVVSGAPAWVSELAEDACAEKCASDTSCPDEGCADCALICSSCPRSHVLAASLVMGLSRAWGDFSWISSDHRERVPDDPAPEGVFHPPRLAAG